ncbi:MAG TPA: head GIN domain-containing protein [Bacteroidales bacterium]|nr:head GIN domain-containing protein [Bacteroidales bacterium]HPT04690.1 head GIN domain-containing protein [Bacteroidales bacterium]
MNKTFNIFFMAFVVIFTQMLPVSQAQNHFGHIGIKGDGNVVKKERNVSGFHAIKSSGGIDVYIIAGKTEKAVVEADENLHDIIVTEVKNGVLTIYPDKSIHNSKALKVHVYFNDLDKITASGGSDVYTEKDVNFDNLTIDMNGGSDIDLNGSIKNLHCYLNGGSDAKFNGSAGTCDFKASGGCDIKASGFVIKKCSVDVEGGSDARLNVTDELSVVAMGGSDVVYSGTAKIISKKVAGASDLTRHK